MSDQIEIQNNLGIDIKVYDSFSGGNDDYFGTLTLIGEVNANSSLSITPIHAPVCALIAFDNDGNPISRYTSLFGSGSFTITAQDLTAISQAETFVKYITSNPASDLSVNFKKISSVSDGKINISGINNFFKQSSDYKDCTFVYYMLALVNASQTPSSKQQPPEDRVYSLSMLVSYLSGYSYPSGFPDIMLKNFSCSDNNDIFKFEGTIELQNLPFESDQIGQNVLSLFDIKEVKVEFLFNHQIGVSIFGTSIRFIANDFNIPIGGGKTITIKKPTVSFDINPLFKFVVFKISAVIPFNIFNDSFNAMISMVIDNDEAEIGAVIDGVHDSLPSPPALKGVHFDEFGVGMGLIFEPPSYALGLSGKFHIGEGSNIVALDDNTFVLVCSMEGDVPNPVYISFYIPKLDLPTLVEIFTDSSVSIDFPVEFEELSLIWSEDPMEPVILPDGSLSDMAFGFSAYMNMFGLKLYSDLQIDMSGLSGTATMSPFSLGEIFSISGDGKAVTVKVDQAGNPIKNNQIATTKQEKDAIANAQTKELVPQGGATISVSTSSSPYFHLDSKVSFLELVNEQIDATIDKNGISFELDFGSIIESKMNCALKDYQNFSANFSYGLDINVNLPTIAGFSLGSIHVVDTCNLGIAINTSASNIDFSAQGGFDFEGININFGPFDLDVNIQKVSDLISACENYILSNVSEIFKDFINIAQQWAGYVGKQIIQGVQNVAEGLKTAFNETENQTASIMNSAGFGMDAAAEGIKEAYGLTASSLGTALDYGYGASASAVASALRGVGYGAEETAEALQSVYNLAPDAINTILQGAGYGISEIEDAFNSIGGAFASFASSTWSAVKGVVDPSNW